MNKLANELYDEISALSIIDSHEHLPSEAEYLASNYCGLNMFAHYIKLDLESAGLDHDFADAMRSGGFRPVSEWWPVIKPHWEHCKNTSYSKALRITAGDLWGIDDINDGTIEEFADKVMSDNTPGLYNRILRDKCNIRYSLTCGELPVYPDDPVLKGVVRVYYDRPASPEGVKNLDDATHIMQEKLRRIAKDGAVGFKMVVGHVDPPDAKKAEAELKEYLADPLNEKAYPALRDFLFDKFLDVAAEVGLTVAVHAGYWGDYRLIDPKHIFSFAPRHPEVHFDLFHLGAPMLRDAALLGKVLPNVSINMVWLPIISQLQAERMLDELIDLVPVNKIIAFGGDYRVCVQKVYGHLVMTRQVVAKTLASRIEKGDFDKEYALCLAEMWLNGNPSRIYGVDRN